MKARTLLLLLVALAIVPRPADAAKCVQLFYDRPSEQEPGAAYGRLLVTFLQNLLGHFPEVEQVVTPVQRYQRHGLDRCESAIYLSAFDGIEIPEAFLEDFATSDARVAWVGYNVDRLGARRLEKLWGVRYAGKGKVDPRKRDKRGEPGYFKYYEYRGETFFKQGIWNTSTEFEVDADVALMEPVEGRFVGKNVVSWMRHSTSDERMPYVLKSKAHWFVADIPFSYVHEEDRYLIFADLLFDILKEKPRHGKRHPALVRFEDVHPAVPPRQIRALAKAAHDAGVPFAISVIPIYRDQTPKTIRASEAPRFVEALKEAESLGGTILMHGVTHQSDDYRNPEGVSGPDYELWDILKNRAMPQDSPTFVVKRMEEGLAALEEAGLRAEAWVTPHYAASLLDNFILAQLFPWHIGRTMYAPFRAHQKNSLPGKLSFTSSGAGANGKRLRFFEDVTVEAGESQPEGQFYPYEIDSDVYGQAVLPENVGYLRPQDEGATEPRYLVDDMLRVLERDHALRDAWGSLYVHPYIVDTPDAGGLGEFDGDTREISRLFEETKKLGYRFIDVAEWLAENGRGDTARKPISVIEPVAAPVGSLGARRLSHRGKKLGG